VQRRRLVEAGLLGFLHLPDFSPVTALPAKHVPRNEHQADANVYKKI
jgi:hypothetical protein